MIARWLCMETGWTLNTQSQRVGFCWQGREWAINPSCHSNRTFLPGVRAHWLEKKGVEGPQRQER